MFQPRSFILLRSPLQSIEKSFELPQSPDSLFEEGLYLSSPEYWNELQKNGLLLKSQNQKVFRTFIKYWLRSCIRCTPYGTFAGWATLNIDQSETKIVLRNKEMHFRCVRLDMNYLSKIVESLVKLPYIRNQIRYFGNNSLYQTDQSFRYAEYSIKNNIRKYHLASVEKTAYLEAILDTAKGGAFISELIDKLKAIEDVTEEEAESFIVELCNSQLLIPAIEPTITGKHSLLHLIEQLEHITEAKHLIEELKKINQLLLFPKSGIDYYNRIESILNNLKLNLDLPKNTIQVDLKLAIEVGRISSDTVNTIVTQMNNLLHLARKNRNTDLEEFKAQFFTKYEDAEIPLSIALDADVGVGYANFGDSSIGKSELIEDIMISKASRSAEVDLIQQYALTKYIDHLKTQNKTIEIFEEELLDIKKITSHYQFPNSMSIMGSLLRDNSNSNDKKFWFDLRGISGPSSANLMGRFTYGDSKLHQQVLETLADEESKNPEYIFAEIAHLPEARIGNILLRPVLREYEIPYVGKSGVDSSRQISIDDLTVQVNNDEIILKSKRLNKRIIPRLSTAHNYSFKSLPVYKFLCHLQNQNLALPIIWDWGLLRDIKQLPRVIYKNIIVKKAQWNIEEQDIKDLPKDSSEHIAYFGNFRQKWQIPSKVMYVENDNELLIDFEKDYCVDLFLYYLRRNKKILIEEFLFSNDNCVIKDIHGSGYTNELIIPVFSEQPLKAITPRLYAENAPKRKFSPLSEWSYFKLYCGPKSGERILKEKILPFVEDGLNNNCFQKFFFVRYKDDRYHLRLRFFCSKIYTHQNIQATFLDSISPFLATNIVDKISIETYYRELERYDNDLIEETESLFFNDSLAVLKFINLLEESNSDLYRLLFSLRGIDMLFNDFKFNLNKKLEIAKLLQNNFFLEFGGGSLLQKHLNEKYRRYQKSIFSHMNKANDNKNSIEEATAIFDERSNANSKIIESIFLKSTPATVDSRIKELIPSYVHMFMNRLFLTNQRKYELVVYHFLERYYTSLLSISKKKEDIFL